MRILVSRRAGEAVTLFLVRYENCSNIWSFAFPLGDGVYNG